MLLLFGFVDNLGVVAIESRTVLAHLRARQAHTAALAGTLTPFLAAASQNFHNAVRGRRS